MSNILQAVLDFADTTMVASIWVKGPHYASLLSHCKSGTAAHAEILRRDSVPCFDDIVDTKAKNCLWAVMEVSQVVSLFYFFLYLNREGNICIITIYIK